MSVFLSMHTFLPYFQYYGFYAVDESMEKAGGAAAAEEETENKSMFSHGTGECIFCGINRSEREII